MSTRHIAAAWGWLAGLSLGSTLISLWSWSDVQAALAGAAILTLAWAKARVILAHYLGLVRAPFWQRGFDTALALFCLVLLGLYLGPALF